MDMDGYMVVLRRPLRNWMEMGMVVRQNFSNEAMMVMV